MEIKKNDNVNLELKRREMFLVALVFISSCLLGLLNWNFSIDDEYDDEMLEEAIQELDFEKLKKNRDMVAAVSKTEEFVEATNMKPADAMVQQEQPQPTTVLMPEAMKSEIPEANVEEVKEQVMQHELDEPEGLHAIEELPEFPGGSGAFMKWITNNIKYPSRAKSNKMKGKVVVSFLVDTQGDVQELKLEKVSNSILGDEVMKAMRRMPKWKPGKQNGKPCTTMVAVPINFEL